MKILGVDSSSKSASVCILDDEKIIGEFFINNQLTHSQTLVPMIDDIMKDTATSLTSIDLFAVTSGPGSFTGVRIGISAVKGMAFALNKPCVTVSTLETMAMNFINEDCIVCSTMDARCNQVYNAIFSIQSGKISRLTEDRAISINDLYIELFKTQNSQKNINNVKKIILVGDGAIICYNSWDKKSLNINLAPEHLRYQRAYAVAQTGLRLFQEGKTIKSSNLIPTYLRPSQAERELKQKVSLN